MSAARIINLARLEICKEDGTLVSPAWRMLNHAERYLMERAETELRGE